MGVKRRARGGGPETRIVTGVVPEERTPGQVERAFRALLAAGGRLRAAGAARRDPACLLRGYTPKHEIRLFDAVYFLTQLREDANFRFFVAYVRLLGERPVSLYPRLFYKDSSLVWRCATHYIDSPQDNWIGKGDLKWVTEGDDEVLYSAEETTNLPLEIQCALDTVSRKAGRVRRDLRALGLVLRKAPDGRVAPYPDFSEPRRRARARRGSRVHGGRAGGLVRSAARSRNRCASRRASSRTSRAASSRSASRRAASTAATCGSSASSREMHRSSTSSSRRRASVWIIPPQPLTTELSSYGVRTLDVETDEDLCVPGYEYHYVDEDEVPPRLYSQIPEGFAGAASDVDPARADASPWLDRLPVIREFRRKVLGALLAAFLLAGPPAAAGLDGRLAEVYAATCATCHTRPETRAPLTGDAPSWREALARGPEALLAHTVEGYRGMPPLGTCGFCSEEDLRRLIEFMSAAPPSGDGRTP